VKAQLAGVTLQWLRGQKLAENLIFFGSSKINGRIFAPTAVTLKKYNTTR
jgi:hypothetical protein